MIVRWSVDSVEEGLCTFEVAISNDNTPAFDEIMQRNDKLDWWEPLGFCWGPTPVDVQENDVFLQELTKEQEVAFNAVENEEDYINLFNINEVCRFTSRANNGDW